MNAQVKKSQTSVANESVVIAEFNEQNVALLQSDINALLATVSEKYGITLRFAIGKTTDASFAARLNGYIGSDTNDSVNPKWIANFIAHASSIGLSQTDLGKQVRNKLLKHPEKEVYRIVGMTPKSNDLIIENSSKKYYRISVRDISFIADEAPVVSALEHVEAKEEIVKLVPEKSEASKSKLDAIIDFYDDESDDAVETNFETVDGDTVE